MLSESLFAYFFSNLLYKRVKFLAVTRLMQGRGLKFKKSHTRIQKWEKTPLG